MNISFLCAGIICLCNYKVCCLCTSFGCRIPRKCQKNLSPNVAPLWLKIIISWCQKATIVVVILVVFVFTIIAIIVSVFVIDVCLFCCFWVVRGVLLGVWTWWYNGCVDDFWSSYSMFSLFISFSLVFLNVLVIKSLS